MRTIVCVTGGWTWIGDYSESDCGRWVVLANAQNVQKYRAGIGGAINQPDSKSVTLGCVLDYDLRINRQHVLWTAEAGQ